ncbi:MAG: hypothetical protein K9J13_05870 [Saprospiraceae bacterium]|nr:hypothetical protein [Saprospiraceae bacterium]
MKIEKLKNYNQKILAIFGTLLILIVVVVIVWSLTEYFRSFRYAYTPNESVIVSEEVAVDNFENNIRTHKISIEDFELIDTLRRLFLIPVSQTSLEMEEAIFKYSRNSGETDGLLNLYGGNSNFYYGQQSFNNALIYDSKDGSMIKLFDKRVSISNMYIEKKYDETFILFAVIDKDTYQDKILDKDDYKTLCIYSTKTETIKAILNENADFKEYYFLEGKEHMIIKYGIDTNKDGTCNWDEPTVLKRYSMKDDKLEPLVSNDLYNELQDLLDGKE